MNAELVYLFAYDIAHEVDLPAVESAMRGTAEWFDLGRLKDAPHSFPIYRPLTIQMKQMTVEGPRGPLVLSPSVKLFDIGALSVKVRVPVHVSTLMELSLFRDLKFGDGTALAGKVHALATQVFQRIHPHLDTPVKMLAQPEGYTVYCIPPAELAAGESVEWLVRNEREVASLLVGEADQSRLSRQEVSDTVQHRYSYYQQDLAVIDWDAALVVDTPEDAHDTLYVMEMANLQLEELKIYDQQLDQVLEKAYVDVAGASRPGLFGPRRRVLDELREIMMDLTKVADEISNITKFFGDWHLARVYMGCASRFHLAEWERTVSQKLKALDSLYTMLLHDSNNRVMLWLEVSIVALFVLDLLLLVMGKG